MASVCIAPHSPPLQRYARDADIEDINPSSPQPLDEDALEEFRSLQQITQEKPLTFSERLLRYPSATTFWTSCKNRYPDVLPREDTRVKLCGTSQEGCDYINANFIFESRDYIATQAPLQNTVNDFWRMVFEQEVGVIVMLTRLTERRQVRASLYWPQTIGETQQYGNVFVTLVGESNDLQVDIRRFEIHTAESSVRYVTHLHYTGWPDFGVPSATSDILNLIAYMDALRRDMPSCGPVVVHCSAGIGRAGTFIALHQACEKLRSHQPPNVLEIVFAMRQCRTGMVQTEEQYAFIYEAMRDFHVYYIEDCCDSLSDD